MKNDFTAIESDYRAALEKLVEAYLASFSLQSEVAVKKDVALRTVAINLYHCIFPDIARADLPQWFIDQFHCLLASCADWSNSLTLGYNRSFIQQFRALRRELNFYLPDPEEHRMDILRLLEQIIVENPCCIPVRVASVADGEVQVEESVVDLFCCLKKSKDASTLL